MTTFEKQSVGITYDDRDSHHARDSHQQRADLPENVMSTWTAALYDYAEQVLQAQRRFANSMLAAAAPMLNVARDITTPATEEDMSANSQRDARSDQRPVDNNTSDHKTSDASRTERANTHAGESVKTREPAAASATDRKLP